MNASDILKYGHKVVHDAIDTLPEGAWTTSGVCGLWSCKDIMAHLASYEQVLAELLASFTDAGPTPTLLRMRLDFGAFNDDEVAARAENTPAEIVGEYDAAHARTMSLISDIAPEVLSRPGTMPWYGEAYALDDLLVYQYYGHKREHMAQVECFRDSKR